jgi:hypothetical protein
MPIKLTVESNSANLSAGGDRVNLSAGGAVTTIRNYVLLTNKPQINSVELVGNKSFADLGLVPVNDFQDGLMSVADYEALKNLKYVKFGAERYPIIGIYAREQGGIIESLVIHVDNGTPDGAGIGLPTGDAVNAAVAIINQQLVNLNTAILNVAQNIPTKTSDLTNDSVYLTLGTLPIWDGGVE